MTQDYWENLYQQVGSGIGKMKRTVQATLFKLFSVDPFLIMLQE